MTQFLSACKIILILCSRNTHGYATRASATDVVHYTCKSASDKKTTFLLSAAVECNHLPSNIKSVDAANCFKRAVKVWLLSSSQILNVYVVFFCLFVCLFF